MPLARCSARSPAKRSTTPSSPTHSPQILNSKPRDSPLSQTGRLAIAIRKGEVWILDRPSEKKPTLANTKFTRFASGLHEPLGLAWHDGALYTAQRSEVTRLRDTDGDDVADEYLTAAKGWGVSGNYHEYAYGPVFDRKGAMWLTLNCTIGKAPRGDGFAEKSFPWRGWSMRRAKDGPLLPISAGLRSPSGIGTNHLGDVFATDQQGNWWGSNALVHLERGVFHGHADSLADCKRPESPLKHPGKLPSGLTTAQAIGNVPGYTPPAVWFPYNKTGASPCGFTCDTSGGKFGPFQNQLFVGEFTYASVLRVFLERVDGQYQGACFRFRSGMKCAVFRTHFLPDGSLVLGETNRGWNSIGTRSYALERLRWTGLMPFEMKTIQARPGRLPRHLHQTRDAEDRHRSPVLETLQLHLQVPPDLRQPRNRYQDRSHHQDHSFEGQPLRPPPLHQPPPRPRPRSPRRGSALLRGQFSPPSRRLLHAEPHPKTVAAASCGSP